MDRFEKVAKFPHVDSELVMLALVLFVLDAWLQSFNLFQWCYHSVVVRLRHFSAHILDHFQSICPLVMVEWKLEHHIPELLEILLLCANYLELSFYPNLLLLIPWKPVKFNHFYTLLGPDLVDHPSKLLKCFTLKTLVVKEDFVLQSLLRTVEIMELIK